MTLTLSNEKKRGVCTIYFWMYTNSKDLKENW